MNQGKKLGAGCLYVFFVLMVGVIAIQLCAWGNQSSLAGELGAIFEVIPNNPDWYTARRIAAYGLMVIGIIATVVALRRLGPLVVRADKGQSEGEKTPITNRFSRGFVYLLVVLAVGVIIMAAFARNAEPVTEACCDNDFVPTTEAGQRGGINLPLLLILPGFGILGSLGMLWVIQRQLLLRYKRFATLLQWELMPSAPPLPEAGKNLVNWLEAKGFMLQGAIKYFRESAPDTPQQITWLYASLDHTIVAGLGITEKSTPEAVFIEFNSIAPDDALLVTGFLTGHNIRSNTLDSTFTRSSPEAAYQQHMSRLPVFTQQHGAAVRIDSSEEYWKHIERTLPSRQHLYQQRYKQTMLAGVMVIISLALTVLMMVIVLPPNIASNELTLISVLSILILVGLTVHGAVIYRWLRMFKQIKA